METTVIELNGHIEYWESSKRALFHHDPEAFFNGREKFFGYVSAHNRRSELVTTAGLTRHDFIVDLTKLTRTT